MMSTILYINISSTLLLQASCNQPNDMMLATEALDWDWETQACKCFLLHRG